jgi:Uma2 family endonuclease
MAIKDPSPLTAVVPERYRFTRQQYHTLVVAGILKDGSRVELIRGEVTVMAAINPRRSSAVKRLNAAFSRGLADRAIIGVQDPFAIGDESEPQPDLTVARPRSDFYSSDHPRPEDLLLVVEVSDTSLRYDREIKVPLYAEAGVVEVWLVNLVDNVLEVYRDPGPKGYRSLQRLSAGDQVSPLAFPDLMLSVDELLPQQG